MMNRKEFLRSIAGVGAAAAGVAVLTSCGGEDNATPDAPQGRNCNANGTNVTIGTNHGHTMTVPKDDVMAGTEKSYNIQGSSAHPHTVVVTTAMFTTLQSNTMVMARSSQDAAHDHIITIVCA